MDEQIEQLKMIVEENRDLSLRYGDIRTDVEKWNNTDTRLIQAFAEFSFKKSCLARRASVVSATKSRPHRRDTMPPVTLRNKE